MKYLNAHLKSVVCTLLTLTIPATQAYAIGAYRSSEMIQGMAIQQEITPNALMGVDELIGRQGSLEKLDQEMNVGISSENVNDTPAVHSKRYERKYNRWLKRLNVLMPSAIAKSNAKIDQMDSTSFSQFVEQTKNKMNAIYTKDNAKTALNLLELKSELEQRQVMKQVNERMVKTFVPKLAAGIAERGGIVPFIFEMKKALQEMAANPKGNLNRSVANAGPCFIYGALTFVLFAAMIAVIVILLGWVWIGTVFPLAVPIFIAYGFYQLISSEECMMGSL